MEMIKILARSWWSNEINHLTLCGSPLPKKKTTIHLGQFRESTGK